jgi:hypothetical protein
MSKKDDILKKEPTEYPLTDEEIVEIASLVALVQQAEAARNFIYSRIIQNIGDRYELTGKELSLNFQEIMDRGAKCAKLIVKD